jgi:transcriptional regulator with XRE-family HTH domain
MANDDQDFARWLRRGLDERGISQRQLAYRAGVHHTTISRLLTGGRQPTHRTARRLLEVLDGRSGPAALRAVLRGDPLLGEHDAAQIMNLYLARREGRSADEPADARLCPACRRILTTPHSRKPV